MSYHVLTKGRCSIIGQDYFVTFAISGRQLVFKNFEAAVSLVRIIHYQLSMSLWAWVIMPDHVHMLVTLRDGSLSSSISKIKGSLSREINKGVSSFKWAKGYYDRALRKEEERIAVARYITANPLRAEVVKSLRHYPWWNAAFL